MANRYYIQYPRNFNNEYTVYVACTERAKEWCEAQVEANQDRSQETWEQITRREAIQRGILDPRWYARNAPHEIHAGGLFGVEFDRGAFGYRPDQSVGVRARTLAGFWGSDRRLGADGGEFGGA